MRNAWAVLLVAAGLTLGLPVRANEKPSDDYRTAMKDIQAASQVRMP
jgi:hypothetical protein